mmetsp:Transcript_68967/g.121967  ORF Transcript_68967/g.121967 Transcript_68967/m.121967 type:complete len:114 (-) Transcript_68967:2657-2998(-)
MPELATEVTAEAIPPLSLFWLQCKASGAKPFGGTETGLGIIAIDVAGDQLPWLFGVGHGFGLAERCREAIWWPTELTGVKRLPEGDIGKLVADPTGSVNVELPKAPPALGGGI